MARRKLLTPAEYADHRRTRGLPGGTRQAVHKAIVDGRIQMLRGRLDPDVADAMWGENSDAGDVASSAPASPEQVAAASSYNTARTAHTRIRARISDLEYRRLARELVPAADVKAQLFEFGRKFRDALLAVGPRVAPLLAGAKTRAERERIITAETRRICEDLSLEPDQVREHAGVSDSALQLLHGGALASAGDLCGEALRLGVRPDPDISLDEWSDRHRWISAEDSPREFGRWRTSRVPFTREIMQKLSANDPTREVVVMKGSQMALTMVLVNLCGYSIAAAPRSVILYEPTTELARQVSRRIDTMIESSPAIASRMLRNTALNKGYYGGQLRLRGAQSPVPFRNLSAPIVIFDDCDGMPGEVGSEGDPIVLGTRRANNFPDRKIVKISTPTLDGASRIKAAFLAGDQRYLHIPCPECGRKDFITWSGFRDFLGQKDGGHFQIEWKDNDPSTTRLVCGNPDCKARIEERWKTWMFERHEWIPLKPENSAIASYNLPALYSPDGWYSWSDAVAEWIGTKGNPIARKGFVNTVLGEAWETKGQGAQQSELELRREHLARGVVPFGAGLLTAAVDTHDDRLEVLVLAWGADEESWPVTFRQFLGNPSENDVWYQLDTFLKTRFKHEMGGELRIECAVVDSGGHHSDEVYQFCAARQARWVYAVRGGTETGRPIVERPTSTNSYRIPLFTLCTDTAKELIYGRLAIDLPEAGKTAAGCIHLARWMDDEAMAQLAAEKGLWRYVPGKGYRRMWKQIRERNELLDLYVYNKAALDILRLHRGIDLAQLAAKYGEAPEGPPPPGPSEGSAVLPPRRRPAFRKTWMGRLKR